MSDFNYTNDVESKKPKNVQTSRCSLSSVTYPRKIFPVELRFSLGIPEVLQVTCSVDPTRQVVLAMGELISGL
jgi:hypothetical protein